MRVLLCCQRRWPHSREQSYEPLGPPFSATRFTQIVTANTCRLLSIEHEKSTPRKPCCGPTELEQTISPGVERCFDTAAINSLITQTHWESKLAFLAPKGVPTPTAVSAFPTEIHTASQSWIGKAYPKLIRYNPPPKGTFRGLGATGIFVSELRDSFRSLR